MTEKFLKLMTDTKSQVQEVRGTVRKINNKKFCTFSHHIQILKIIDEVFKEATGKKYDLQRNRNKNYIECPFRKS